MAVIRWRGIAGRYIMSEDNKKNEGDLKRVARMCADRIPPAAVQQRKNGAGVMLSYADQHYIISRLNEVFGCTGWESRVIHNRLVAEDIEQVNGKGRWYVSYSAKVRLTAKVGDEYTAHDGTGHGHGFGARKGDAIESAQKEAETDALKRAARYFGPSLGLALYDKEQEDVGALLYDNGGVPIRVAVEDAYTRMAVCTSVAELYNILADTVRPLCSRVDADEAGKLQAAFKSKLKELKNA